MKFKEAVILLDLLNVLQQDLSSNFVLTKSALKKKFSKKIVQEHPERSCKLYSTKEICFQRFRMVLQAHRYLRKCLLYDVTTYAKALKLERNDPQWDVKLDDDDDYRSDMGSIAYKVQQMGLDTKDITAFMMEEVCVNDDGSPEGNRQGIITCDDIVEFLSHTAVQALVEGIKYWKTLSPDNMALYLSAHDCDPSSFWDDDIKAMDKEKMIFACMNTYAPLINKFCYVKGLSSATWNDRLVRTVDFKKVNNIGKYTIEWTGSAGFDGSTPNSGSASSSADGSNASGGGRAFAIIKPGNLVPVDNDDDDDDDDDDDEDDDDDDDDDYDGIDATDDGNNKDIQWTPNKKKRKKKKKKKKKKKNLKEEEEEEEDEEDFTPTMIITEDGDIECRFPMERMSIGNLIFTNECNVGIQRGKMGEFNMNFVLPSPSPNGNGGDDIHGQFPIRPDDPCVEEYAVSMQCTKPRNMNFSSVITRSLVNPCFIYLHINLRSPAAKKSAFCNTLYANYPQFKETPKKMAKITVVLEPRDSRVLKSLLELLMVSDIPPVPKTPDNIEEIASALVKHSMNNNNIPSFNGGPNSSMMSAPLLVNSTTSNRKQKEFLKSGLQQLKDSSGNNINNNNNNNHSSNHSNNNVRAGLRFKAKTSDGEIHELDINDMMDISEDFSPLMTCPHGTCSDCGGALSPPPSSNEHHKCNAPWRSVGVGMVKVSTITSDEDSNNDDDDDDTDDDLPPLVPISQVVPGSSCSEAGGNNNNKSRNRNNNKNGGSGKKSDTNNNNTPFKEKDQEINRLGEKVDIYGLASRSDLNGLSGVFMGRSVTKKNEVRYKIQVNVRYNNSSNDNKTRKQIFLLKKENFRFRHIDEIDTDEEEYDSDRPPPLMLSTDVDNNNNINKNNNKNIKNKEEAEIGKAKRSTKGKKDGNNNKESAEDKFMRLQKDLEAKDKDGNATRLMYQTFTPEEEAAIAKLQGTDVNTVRSNYKGIVTDPTQTQQQAQASENGPRKIMATFKCPKNKKPGDVIEVVNPHQLGQKIKVTIPKGTKPKKQFRVLVPLPEKKLEVLPSCCVCSKILPKEEDDPDNNIRAPLRVCEHLCCKICHGLVEGKLCPKCKSPVPKNDTFKLFPFVQHLDNADPIIDAMLAEYLLYKESLRDEKDKSLNEALEEAGEKTMKAVDKHYRRASLKVHPDRFGDQFREQFDRLTKARNVLRDEKLRRSYMDEMVVVACKANLGLIPQSHSLWIEKNDPDKKDQARPEAQKEEAGKKKATLRIDGGLMNSKPKRPVVNIRENHLIYIYMPITNRHQFEKYAQKLTIYGSCGNLSEEEVVLKEIPIHNDPTSKFTIDEGGIATTVQLSEGIWDVFWSTTVSYDEGETEFETPKSSEARVDFRSGEQQKMLSQLSGLKLLANRRAVLLRSTIKSKIPTERQQIEERHNELHHIIVKAIDIKNKLQKVLKIANEKACPSLDTLETAIRDAQAEKERFEDAVGQYEKRDVRKEFRRFLATQLECGMGEIYISNISREDLSKKGGDTNRLYQLLIEGKKTSSLAFNESVIAAAERRDDLFTPKQRETLRDKIMSIAEASAKELEQAMEEEEKQMKEDVERKLLEERAKALGFGRGQTVLIHDLASRSDLNGSTAYYMGLGEDDRYIVKLAGTGKEISLRKENFSVWDETKAHAFALAEPDFTRSSAPVAPKPKKDTISPTFNSVKGTAKNAQPPSKSISATGTSSRTDTHEKACRICLEENRPETMISPCDCKGSGQWVHKHCLDEWRAKNGNLNRCSECLVEYRIVPKATAAAAVKTASPKAKKAPETREQHGDVSSFTKVVTKKTEPKKPTVQSNTNDFVYTKKRRCYHEINCFHLRRAPDGCSFFHTKEEILFHHPNYREPAPCELNQRDPNNDSFTTKTCTTAAETVSSADGAHSKEMLVESNSVGHVLGKNHKNLIRMMNETDTKIKLSKKNANGSVLFKVCGASKQKVDSALKLMLDAANHSGGYTAPPHPSPVKPAAKPIPTPPPSRWAPADPPPAPAPPPVMTSSPSAVPAAAGAVISAPSQPVSRMLGSDTNVSRPAVTSQTELTATETVIISNGNGNIGKKISNDIGTSANNHNNGIINTNNNTVSYQPGLSHEDSTSILSGLTGDGDSFLENGNTTGAVGGIGIVGSSTNDYNMIGGPSILPPFTFQPQQQQQDYLSPIQHNLAQVTAPSQRVSEGTIGPISESSAFASPSSYFLPSSLLTSPPLQPPMQTSQTVLPNVPGLLPVQQQPSKVITSTPPPPPGLVAPGTSPLANDNEVSNNVSTNNNNNGSNEDDEVDDDYDDHENDDDDDDDDDNEEEGDGDALLEFLVMKKDCFKVTPNEFHTWLTEQDILTMDDLIEACEDEDFVTDEMRDGGLKAFKKKGFIKAVSSYCDDNDPLYEV